MSRLPGRVALEDPPGDPSAWEELISAVTGAAFRLGVLTAHLAGPAARAPGWIGADAAAAAVQIGTVVVLLGQQHDAVGEAVRQLSAHRDLLLDVRSRIRALRAAQEEDYAVAAARLHSALGDTRAGWDAAAVAELERAEEARSREHARLHAEIADDAAATAAVLAASTQVVGGRGRPGDADRVLAHLAARLPGWGVPALAAAGWATGRAAREWSADEVGRALDADSALLDSSAYAAALLSAMGADRFTALVAQLGLPESDPRLPEQVGAVVGAAWGASRGAGGGLAGVLRAPLRQPLGPTTAVGLGRMARSGQLPPTYLAELLGPLATAERTIAGARRDQLAAAPGEDPLAEVLGALSRTGDADLVSDALADRDLWPGLLARRWTEGTTPLTDAIRAGAAGEQGAELTVAVLDAVGGAVDLVISHVGDGLPEAFTIAAVSDAVGQLVAVNLSVVTDTILVSLGEPGRPSRPLDADATRLLAGLGLVTTSGPARVSVLEALVAAGAAASYEGGAGVQAPEAYAHGGVFAAMAYGEAQDIRRHLYSAVAAHEADERSWAVITAPLDLLPWRRAGYLVGAVVEASEFLGPGELPLEAFWEQPATGASQAAFSAVVASIGHLVEAGRLPDPGPALDRGLGSVEARAYEASLSPTQRDVWDEIVAGANGGYLAVGQELGFLPG